MNVKKDYIFLCIAYFLIYFSNAFFMAFFQIFLLSKGFNESKIGIISSITPLLCIIANPIYSLIGKNNKKIKILLFILDNNFIKFIYKFNLKRFSGLINNNYNYNIKK